MAATAAANAHNKRCLSVLHVKERHASNCLLHLPGKALSLGAVLDLAAVGGISFFSTVALNLAAIFRTGDKTLVRQGDNFLWVREMATSSEYLPLAKVVQVGYCPTLWDSEPFVVTLKSAIGSFDGERAPNVCDSRVRIPNLRDAFARKVANLRRDWLLHFKAQAWAYHFITPKLCPTSLLAIVEKRLESAIGMRGFEGSVAAAIPKK